MSQRATASGRDGMVTLFGRNAGTTRLEVIAFGRTVHFEVTVNGARGNAIVPQQTAIVSPRNATTDTRYVSTTKQIQSAIQVTTPQTKVSALIVRDAQKTSIPSASIQVGKTTILDHAVAVPAGRRRMRRPVSTTAACAFLGRRWQRRQARGPQDSTRGTDKARGRSILQPAVSGVGGGRLRRPVADAGEGRA